MAYDEGLAQRIRDALADERGITERKMFGGLAFMTDGNMSCGVVGDELMVRVGPAAHEESLSQPHARAMDFTGKPMKGMIYVGVDGIDDDDGLERWVRAGLRFARTFPPK